MGFDIKQVIGYAVRELGNGLAAKKSKGQKMDYKEMENKMMEFIKIEPNLSDEQADAQAKSLAKNLGLTGLDRNKFLQQSTF